MHCSLLDILTFLCWRCFVKCRAAGVSEHWAVVIVAVRLCFVYNKNMSIQLLLCLQVTERSGRLYIIQICSRLLLVKPPNRSSTRQRSGDYRGHLSTVNSSSWNDCSFVTNSMLSCWKHPPEDNGINWSETCSNHSKRPKENILWHRNTNTLNHWC